MCIYAVAAVINVIVKDLCAFFTSFFVSTIRAGFGCIEFQERYDLAF